MHVKYLSSLWRTIRIPGMVYFMRDWRAMTRMHFLYAALEAGLLQALRVEASRETLMKKLKVYRPELLDALLEVGLSLKEIALDNGIYRLRGKRSRVLASPQGDALAAMVEANATYYADAYRCLADRMRGAPLGNDLEKIGEIVARFSKILEPYLDTFIHSLIPSSGVFRILDVGCGSGFVLRAAFMANAQARGTGIDVDTQVAAQARSNLAQWGIEDHFSILVGDIQSCAGTLQAGFDVITAFNLLYYFPVQDRPQFLTLLHTLLAPNGRLALVNTFQSRGQDISAANLNMVNCSLDRLTALPDLEVTQAQLHQAGFSRIKVNRFMPGSEFYGITAWA